MDFPLKDLQSFLVVAHGNTYANGAVKRADSLRPGSKDYHFEDGGFVYHDTYFGGANFIGEEVVYFSNKPTWGMNYYGFGDIEFDDTLRPFLMQEPWEALPVRGPEHSTHNGYAYMLELREGDFEHFSLEETITRSEQVVYRCYLSGGRIH